MNIAVTLMQNQGRIDQIKVPQGATDCHRQLFAECRLHMSENNSTSAKLETILRKVKVHNMVNTRDIQPSSRQICGLVCGRPRYRQDRQAIRPGFSDHSIGMPAILQIAVSLDEEN